jgi:hypothetical protein
MDKNREEEIWALAQKDPRISDGQLELDMHATISEGDDNGAYIQTWMWVSFAGTPLDKEKEA